MVDLNSLSDRELRAKLLQFNMDVPVTQSTRSLVIRKLKAVMEAAGNGNGSTSHRQTQQHEEPTAESRSPSVRRRSAAPAPKPKSARQQRMSLAPTATDESDGQEDMPLSTSNARKPSPKRNHTPLTLKSGKQSLNGNGNGETANNSHAADQMSDEELLRQLAKYNIQAPAITFSTRPLLLKKLNHAMAKSKRESKSFKTPSPVTSRPAEPENDTQESEQESDNTDNATNASTSSFHTLTKDRRSVTPASLTFSQQHSLTMGNNSPYSYSNSLLAPRQPDYISQPFIPTPRPSIVINRCCI